MARRGTRKFKIGDVVEHKNEAFTSVGWRGIVKRIGKRGYWLECFVSWGKDQIRWLDEEDLQCCPGVIAQASDNTRYCKHCQYHSICLTTKRQDCNKCTYRAECFTTRTY
jgi:hypothetical protein